MNIWCTEFQIKAFFGLQVFDLIVNKKYTLHVVRRAGHNLNTFVNIIIWYDHLFYKLAAVKKKSAPVLIRWNAMAAELKN